MRHGAQGCTAFPSHTGRGSPFDLGDPVERKIYRPQVGAGLKALYLLDAPVVQLQADRLGEVLFARRFSLPSCMHDT